MGWISRDNTRSRGLGQGMIVCAYQCTNVEHGAAVRPQTDNAIWDGVIYWFVGLGRIFCGVQEGKMLTGLN